MICSLYDYNKSIIFATGPAGTGKTYTLINTIKDILANSNDKTYKTNYGKIRGTIRTRVNDRNISKGFNII